MLRSYRTITLAIAGLFISVSHLCRLSAQENNVHLLDSLTVVESAVRSITESSAPMQRYTLNDIRRLGATNVADALKHMSGVTVRDYGGVGGLKNVGIRGLGAQHTAVFYDGVSIGDCQSGQVDLGRYSANNLSNMELLIGQGDDIYCTARMLAAAGVISLETAATENNSVNDWNILGQTSSYDSYKGSIRYNTLLGKQWKFSTFGEYTTSQGDYPYTIKNQVTTINGTRSNSEIEEIRGEVNLAWRPNTKHLLRIKLYAYGSNRGLPGGVIVENPLTTEKLHSENYFGQMFYEYIHSEEVKMKFALKHNTSYDRHRDPIATTISINRYRQQESDLSYTAMWVPKFAKGFSFAWSEELFFNKLSTTNSHVDMPTKPERLTTLSAFSTRYTYKTLSITASMLHTYASESALGGNTAPDKSRFSPAIAMLFYPFPKENFCLRASYKSIFRMPTFNDLYYREVGNYKLTPEKTEQYNIGAAYSLHPHSWLKEMTFSIDAYHGKVKDKIVAVPGVFMWKMSNVDKVDISGADISVKSTLAIASKTTASISTTYSYMRAVNHTEGSPLYGHQIVYTPLHSGSADIALLTPLAEFGYSFLWSGARYHLAQNIPSNEIESYGDHSIWVLRKWKIKNTTLQTKAEIKNIGDSNYEIIRYYPMPGRNYAITIILTL